MDNRILESYEKHLQLDGGKAFNKIVIILHSVEILDTLTFTINYISKYTNKIVNCTLHRFKVYNTNKGRYVNILNRRVYLSQFNEDVEEIIKYF